MIRSILGMLSCLLIVITFGTILPSWALADSSLDISNFTDGGYLTRQLKIYEQKVGGAEPNEVPSEAFQAPTREIPSYSYTHSILWVLLPVKNPVPVGRSWILEVASTGLDHIDVFTMDAAQGRKRLFSAGDLYPYENRTVDHPNFFFPLFEKPLSETRYLVRIQSTSSISIPLRAWSPEGLASRISKEMMAVGVFYGALIALFLLNLVIWLYTRDSTYFYYILFLFISILFQVSNDALGFQYLWGHSLDWNSRSALCTGLLSVIAGAQFIRKFLDLRVHSRLFDRGFIVIGVIAAFVIILVPYVTYRSVAFTSLVIGAAWVLLAIAAGFTSIRRGYSPAKWYTASWYLLIAGIAIYILRMADLIPWNVFTNSAVKIGTLLEAIAMSLALGQRIRVLRQSHALATQEAETERSLRRIVEAEANLASQVAHDIRSPLAALSVLQWDMQSLPEETRLLFRSATERIREITGQLLTRHQKFPEPQSATSALSIEPAVEMIETLLNEKRLQYRELRSLELVTSNLQAGRGLYVRVQKTEFMRVFSNLINNAVEALEGQAGKVTVSLQASNQQLVLIIRDTGKGIPSKILSNLGERGTSYDKQGGSGLGLAHARESLLAWGGSLRIESELGQGTQVILELPIA